VKITKANSLGVNQWSYKYSSKFAHFCNFHLVSRIIIGPPGLLIAVVGVETSVKWEADNSMNVPSQSTKPWLVIVALQRFW